jgi:hypothetical protein
MPTWSISGNERCTLVTRASNASGQRTWRVHRSRGLRQRQQQINPSRHANLTFQKFDQRNAAKRIA